MQKKALCIMIIASLLLCYCASAEKNYEEIFGLGKAKKDNSAQIKSNLAQIREKIQNVQSKATELKKLKFNKELGFKARILSQSERKKIAEALDESELKGKIVENSYRMLNNEVSELNKQKQNCVKGTETCNEIEGKLYRNYKKIYVYIADILIKNMNKLKAAVLTSEEISAEGSKQQAIKIEKRISEIEYCRDSMSTVKNLSAKEITAQQKSIKEEWEKSSILIGEIQARLKCAKVGKTIVQLNDALLKMNLLAEKLMSNETDIAGIENLLDEFEIKIDLLSSEYENAMQLLGSQKIKEGIAALEGIKKMLDQARTKQKEILGLIKSTEENKKII